jgi:5-methylcytosine-specific restriction endonuclease McrA
MLQRSRTPYGAPAPSKPKRWYPANKRYQSSRWRKLAKSVRTGRACWLCGRPAEVADHVRHVTRETSDAEFFDRAGLRPACRKCNLRRGSAEALRRDTERAGSVLGSRPDYTRR